MSDVIRLLPDSVANQIAAGEVIQRPASVIKELVENSVDAGANEINIYLKDAGRTLIQVVDNGKGMSDTDARLAFERHATSKIRTADDLFALSTMGFRGEALPSICAISQVELRTMTETSKIGTRVLINGSKVESQEPCMCAKGCNIMVKNIFYNVPARRKFLKSDTVELANIMREFERLALVNNNIRISLDTGSKKYDLLPATFKQRICDLWKGNMSSYLLPIEIDTSLVKISGFITKPEAARRRNALQFLIVNGRNMRHPLFHKAITSCFELLIPKDTFPSYFLKFEVDPNTIDVNIHPTKSEIKFENEKQIWSILQAAVKSAVGKFTPQIAFDVDPIPFDPPREGAVIKQPSMGVDVSYNPFAVQTHNSAPVDAPPKVASFGKPISETYRATKIDSNWQNLYERFSKQTDSCVGNTLDRSESQSLPIDDNRSVAQMCLQFADKYIVVSSNEKLMLIDQHRAHLKILFEKYMSKSTSVMQSSQRLMFAETLVLDSAQQLVLEEIEDDLKRIGFMVEYESENSWSIIGVPPMLDKKNPKDVLLQIISSVNDDVADEKMIDRTMIERIALLTARYAAIQGGQKLSNSEMEHIVAELFSLPEPMYTPNGNLIIKVIGEEKVHNMFS